MSEGPWAVSRDEAAGGFCGGYLGLRRGDALVGADFWEDAAEPGRGLAPVALSAFFPGDDYSTDLQDDEQVAPLEDPSMPNGEGEYIGMGDGEDDDEIQNLSDNPAMTHVATGRVFEVQRQVFVPCIQSQTGPQWKIGSLLVVAFGARNLSPRLVLLSFCLSGRDAHVKLAMAVHGMTSFLTASPIAG